MARLPCGTGSSRSKLVSVFNQKSGGIQDHQHLGEQSFHIGFAGFAGDQLRDFGFPLVKQALKFAQDRDSSCARLVRPTPAAQMAPAQSQTEPPLLMRIRIRPELRPWRDWWKRLAYGDLQIGSI